MAPILQGVVCPRGTTAWGTRNRVSVRRCASVALQPSTSYLCGAPLWRTAARCTSARTGPGRSSLHISAELKVGDRLQDSADYYRVLKTSDGKSMALSNFQGKKPVVLFFYPKAATPGCTKQACGFRDRFGKFKDAGVEVFGISTDPPEVNAEFAKAQRLTFPLLSDQNGFLRKSFGIKADMLGLLPGRQTYVIDKDGTVVMSFNSQFNTDGHIEEALAAIAKL